MRTLPEGFAPYDTADYLNTEAEIAEYLIACAEYDDAKLMLNALNVIARVRNKAELAREVGLSRPGLYRALAPGANPSFSTVQSIAKELGLKISFRLQIKRKSQFSRQPSAESKFGLGWPAPC